MFKFLHTADIHLDSPLRGLESYPDAPVADIRGATRRAFDGLIDLALDEAVAFLLISGDLYDGDWRDYNTGLYFVGRMGRLAQAGIKVFIVSGNHDAASQLSKTMPLPENVKVFSADRPESICLEELSVVIHGQSYATKSVTDNLALGYPRYLPGYCNIGMLHTSLTGRPGHESYAPCTIDDLIAKGYDYWALGHVHRGEIVCREPWLVFPGNIQGRHIREEGVKGATLVTVREGRIDEVEERPLDVLRWHSCEVDVSDCRAVDEVYDVVRRSLKNTKESAAGRILAVRLVFVGRTAIHAELFARTNSITEEIRGIAEAQGDIWVEQVRYRTRPLISHDDLLYSDSGPFAELLHATYAFDPQAEDIFTLVPELRTLQSKLPFEIAAMTQDDTALLSGLPAETKLMPLRYSMVDETVGITTEELREFLLARLLQCREKE